MCSSFFCFLLLFVAFCCFLLFFVAFCCFLLHFVAFCSFLLLFVAFCCFYCFLLLFVAFCCFLLFFVAFCCFLLHFVAFCSFLLLFVAFIAFCCFLRPRPVLTAASPTEILKQNVITFIKFHFIWLSNFKFFESEEQIFHLSPNSLLPQLCCRGECTIHSLHPAVPLVEKTLTYLLT